METTLYRISKRGYRTTPIAGSHSVSGTFKPKGPMTSFKIHFYGDYDHEAVFDREDAERLHKQLTEWLDK